MLFNSIIKINNKKFSEIIRVAQHGNLGVNSGKPFLKIDSLQTEKGENSNIPFKKIPKINLVVKK